MKLATLLYGIIPLVFFSSCSSSQQLQNFVLQEQVPFEIVEYYYQDWPQHTRTSPAGIHVTIVLKENLNSIELKELIIYINENSYLGTTVLNTDIFQCFIKNVL